jgi:phage tail-like protein
MEDDGSKQTMATWPLVKFSFRVIWDGMEIIFQEVTGLEASPQPVEYRSGTSKLYSTVKMPDILKFGNVTCKKGIYKGDNSLWNNYSAIKMGTLKKWDVTINLLDENGNTAMTWVLLKAYPAKITVTSMKADGNEIAVETVEFAHEGLSLEN